MKYPIQISRVQKSRIHEVDFDNLQFGKHYSDHMFIAEYRNEKWQNARIVPFANLSLSPATTFIHYGQSIFEGMKAHKDAEGNPLMFRANQNFKRFNISAARMCMQEVPYDLFMDSINELIYLDRDWIPSKEGCSMYVRPFMYATDEYIGVRESTCYNYMVITSPASKYYSNPLKILVAEEYVRAFPGGTGFAKASGNYGAAMYPYHLAHQKGYDQVLWVDGKEFKYAEEMGTMNIFFIIDGVAVTPQLDGTILDGVTRDSVLQLLKTYGVKTEERKISLDEIADAHRRGKFNDAFGTGTAAAVSHVASITYKGKEMLLPPVEQRLISNRLQSDLAKIKTGRIKDEFGWITMIKGNLTTETVK